MSLLSEILSSRTRAGVFSVLFGWDPQELHAREISRRTEITLSTVQQELKKLVGLDLVERRQDGNRVCFKANRLHPLFSEIRNLTVKTSGIIPLLRTALLPVAEDIVSAFVFGSVARSEELAHSDIDIMIIGNLGLRKVSSLMTPVCQQMDREVNPYTLTPESFSKRCAEKDVFFTHVLGSNKLFLIGGEDELSSMA